ncbi:MAG: hypothetical protein HY245_08000 [Rhizobiales bacterium]|nr:hypothetical protein [Hyphomicrobiales bacterium]
MRESLRYRGFLYPVSCRYHFAQHRLAFSLCGRRDPDQRDVPDFAKEGGELIREIQESDCPSVVLSSEVFFSLSRSGISLMGALFKDYDVRVLAVLRRPDSLFESIYNQRVKEPKNRFARPHAVFLEDPYGFSADLNFESALDNWTGEFGSEAVTVGCYEEIDDIISFAANAIGLDLSGLPPQPQRINTSVSPKTAELIRLGKQAKLGEPQLRRLLSLGNALFGMGDKSDSILSPRERIHLLRRMDQMTAAVFERYLKRHNIYSSARFSRSDFAPETVLTPLEIVTVMSRLALEDTD